MTTTPPAPIAPTLNPNGTRADVLIARECEVMAAASELLARLVDAAPQEVDYTLTPGAWAAVQSQYNAEVDAVTSLVERRQAIGIAIADARDAATHGA